MPHVSCDGPCVGGVCGITHKCCAERLTGEKKSFACLYPYRANHCTEKSAPPDDKEDGTARPPLGSIMVRGSKRQKLMVSGFPRLPVEVALQPDKLTVPKSASGKTLPDQ